MQNSWVQLFTLSYLLPQNIFQMDNWFKWIHNLSQKHSRTFLLTSPWISEVNSRFMIWICMVFQGLIIILMLNIKEVTNKGFKEHIRNKEWMGKGSNDPVSLSGALVQGLNYWRQDLSHNWRIAQGAKLHRKISALGVVHRLGPYQENLENYFSQLHALTHQGSNEFLQIPLKT